MLTYSKFQIYSQIQSQFSVHLRLFQWQEILGNEISELVASELDQIAS